ncbi:hypothetical protein M2E93_14770, partial [Klebsiella pneumoniae]|nr:hypothetical protein [Klebsiella pneumoniae]
RITPSVAEQEGQQTETEATGAPQKHHYTLNQQVGSITSLPLEALPPSIAFSETAIALPAVNAEKSPAIDVVPAGTADQSSVVFTVFTTSK